MPTAPSNLEVNLPTIEKLTALMGRLNFSDHYPEINYKWAQLIARAKIYGRLAGYKKFTKSWLANKNTLKHLRHLQLGIEALEELSHQQNLNDHERENIEWEIRCALDAELSFLEIRQFRKLIKDQDIYRTEIVVLQNSLRFKIEQLRKKLQAHKHSKQFPFKLWPKLHVFFRLHEKCYFDFEQAIFATTVTGEIVGTASSGITIGRFVPDSVFKTVDPRILITIPSVSAIVTSIPLILGMIQTHVENRYLAKKIFDTALSVIVVVGIAVAIKMPVTVPAISSTFYSLAILKDYYYPLIGIFRERYRKKKEVNKLNEKILQIYTQEPKDTYLDERDKSILLKKLEEHCAAHTDILDERIEQARQLVTRGRISIADVASNSLFKEAIKAEQEIDVKKFFYQQTHQHKQRLTNEINLINASLPKRLALAGNGAITIVGAVLFAIPTPITMLAGASIMAGSYAITIIIKYDFVPKFYNFIRDKFFRPKEETVSSQQNYFKYQPAMQHMHSALAGEHKTQKVDVDDAVKAGQKELSSEVVNDFIEPPTGRKLSRAFV